MESSDLAFEAGLWNEEEQNYFLLLFVLHSYLVCKYLAWNDEEQNYFLLCLFYIIGYIHLLMMR